MAIKTNTRYGEMVYLENDNCIGKSLELYGEWAQNEVDVITQCIQENDIVLDIGANYGVHTLAIANKLGENGLVYSFEAQKKIFDILDTNTKISIHCNKIKPLYSLVGESNTNVYVNQSDMESLHNYGAVSFKNYTDVQNTRNDIPLLMITVDSLELKKCDFIKIDVEGMEYSVLKGSSNTIKKNSPIIFFEANNIEDSWKIITYLETLANYSFFLHSSSVYNTKNFKANMDDIFDGNMETNIFAITKDNKFFSFIQNNSLPIIGLESFILAMLNINRSPEHPMIILKSAIFNTIDLDKTYNKILSLGEELSYARSIVEERDRELKEARKSTIKQSLKGN